MRFRERANLQLVNRRLERKVKEMVMQGEEEQHSLQDQKDQVWKHTTITLSPQSQSRTVRLNHACVRSSTCV